MADTCSISEVEAYARKNMTPAPRGYVFSGSDDGAAVEDNVEAYKRCVFGEKCLCHPFALPKYELSKYSADICSVM